MIQRREKYFGTAWARLKYGYFIAAALFFTWVYFHFLLGRNAGWVEEPPITTVSSTAITILIFRRPPHPGQEDPL